jgi:hypothetical protein
MAEGREPTVEDVQALVCAATPHFSFQIRARVRDLIRDLPSANPVRRFGEEQLGLLDQLGHSTSNAAEGPLEPPDRIGWETIPSHRPVRSE